jgi:hypothetical protein
VSPTINSVAPAAAGKGKTKTGKGKGGVGAGRAGKGQKAKGGGAVAGAPAGGKAIAPTRGKAGKTGKAGVAGAGDAGAAESSGELSLSTSAIAMIALFSFVGALAFSYLIYHRKTLLTMLSPQRV